MVIMDRQDYVNKSNQLLDQPAYRAIPRDPMNKIKTKLINRLKRVKSQTGLDNNTYKAMYLRGCRAPKFYGLPRSTSRGTPLRTIVSSCRSVTYGVSNTLTKILKPLVCKSPHHINSNQDYAEQIKNESLLPGECLSAVHLSPSRSSPRYYQGSTGKRPCPQEKNNNVSRGQSSFIRILPQKYLLLFPGPVL